MICEVLDVWCIMSDMRHKILGMKSKMWGIDPNNKLAKLTQVPNKANLLLNVTNIVIVSNSKNI